MDALDLLHNRVSAVASELTGPAPDDAALARILEAGVSAPDHGGLTPWRFIIIRGDARRRLGDLFAEALAARNPRATVEQLEARRAKPLRAPLIITVAAALDPDHPKIPELEQILAAGAAAEHVALATRALGFAAVWLTGEPAYDARVQEGLGLAPEDRIVGFLYIGTPSGPLPERSRPDARSFTQEWSQPRSLETL